jgi:hypothetical protein
MKRTLAALFLFCVAAPAFSQQPCNLKLSDAPELRGFKLGMTVGEAKSKVDPTYWTARPDEIGLAKITIFPLTMLNDERADGVNVIKLEFLDDRLTHIEVNYDHSAKWQGVDQFAERVSEGLGLPKAWRVEPTVDPAYRRYGRMLHCGGFNVVAVLSGESGGTVMLGEAGLKEVIEKRRAEVREKSRKKFKP